MRQGLGPGRRHPRAAWHGVPTRLRRGHECYLDFCRQFSLQPVPASDETLAYFVGHMRRRGMALATARQYLAAVRRLHLQWGQPLPPGQPPYTDAAIRGYPQRLVQSPTRPRHTLTVDPFQPPGRTLAARDASFAATAPLFLLQDGSALSRPTLNATLRAALGPGFSSHSLRIGLVTSACEAGVEDSVIQRLGRWSSGPVRRLRAQPAAGSQSGPQTGRSARRPPPSPAPHCRRSPAKITDGRE